MVQHKGVLLGAQAVYTKKPGGRDKAGEKALAANRPIMPFAVRKGLLLLLLFQLT